MHRTLVAHTSNAATTATAAAASAATAAMPFVRCLALQPTPVAVAARAFRHAAIRRIGTSSLASTLTPSTLARCTAATAVLHRRTSLAPFARRFSSQSSDEKDAPAASSNNASDASSKSSSTSLVATGSNAVDRAEFLPAGQLPHPPTMLLLPVARPTMPGLLLDIDLRMYPSTTRAALEAAIASGQPYVTLVLLKPEARARCIDRAELHWTKKERQEEGLEKPDPPERPSKSDSLESFFVKLREETKDATSANASEPTLPKQRVPIFPELTSLDLVYSIGVAAEIKIVGAHTPTPRLTALAHRRVHILGPATLTEANVTPSLEEMRASVGDTDIPTDATPSTTSVPSNTAAAAAAAEAIPAPLRARVKHIFESPNDLDEKVSNDSSDNTNVSTTATTTPSEMDFAIKAYVKEINQTITALSGEDAFQQRIKPITKQIRQFLPSAAPGRMADLAAAMAAASETDLQKVLETVDVKERLDAVLALWRREQADLRYQKEAAAAVAAKYQKAHDRISLKETLKALDSMITKETAEKHRKAEEDAKARGEAPPQRPPPRGNDKESLRQRFLARIGPESGKTVPEAARKVIDEELTKLASMDADASEYQLTRNYLDWLTSQPWGIYTKERFDIEFAEEVLDKEHYGMDDIKQRIYEFIASGVLLKNIPPGKILCLVGPPGVGKTSIGKSIARALDRKFYRLSVGGMDDVSEIKGHRRTYVGSMPGKLVQALKRVESANPVILIDEIDKLGRGNRGDPASALLEVLDPEQNSAFMDHYLDVPVDLSKVLFICTANDRSLIPGPLADRMDFIPLSGYVLQEKVHIAQNHLIPLVRAKTGVAPEAVTLTDDALLHLIRWYCREAGVRGLQKQLEKIFSKVALKIARANAELETSEASPVEATTTVTDATATKPAEVVLTPPVATASPLPLPLVITPDNLVEYVGKPLHSTDRMYEENPVGVCTGLGTNSLGGWLLYVECTVADQNIHIPNSMTIPSAAERTKQDRAHALARGELFCTGQLGDVIRESSSIAYTVAKRLLQKYTQPGSRHRHFFNRHRVHLHLPEGATPKDGPSAGIAMVTGLLSLALDTPPIQGHAMTGELTLTGLVLPIGGVKEKLMAAKHAGVTLVILPEENRKDVVELKPYITEGLDIHYARHYEDVFKLVFPHFKDDVPVYEVPVAEAVQPVDLATAQADQPKKKRTTKKKTPAELPPVGPTPKSPSQQTLE